MSPDLHSQQHHQANTWFNRTPEVVGAATKVSGWPLRMVSGDGNANVVGGAVVLPGLNCITLMAGRVAPGWVDDCASCTSSRCWMLSTDVATVVDGRVTTGATATKTWQVQHMEWKWVKSYLDKLNKRKILPDNTYKLCTQRSSWLRLQCLVTCCCLAAVHKFSYLLIYKQ